MPDPPVWEGMPPTDRTFTVEPWGQIRCGGPCKDDYDRIEIYHQVPGQRYVKLQKAALESFKAAERAVGAKIYLTGSWRSCATQAALYATDQSRFAAPSATAHCRGLAIDVDMNQSARKREQIHKALRWRDWHQSRPDDEPWHWSMGVKT